MKNILVIRFSAMGDVAMTIPVIYSLAHLYPDVRFTVLSRKAFQPLFQNKPSNVSFLGVDLKEEYKGLRGVNKLFCYLRSLNFDAVADLHDVLRTCFLRTRFRMAGIPVASIGKGRKEKEELTRIRNKVFKPLKSTFIRYAEVFECLGLKFENHFKNIYDNLPSFPTSLGIKEKGEEKWVGIAPFAKHTGKIYPLALMEKVIESLTSIKGVRVFLFGGGKQEETILSGWENDHPHTVSLPGKLNMKGELAVISQLDVMLSMDSANMHLASLVNVPVVSIWGATHPYAGFMGWNQDTKNTVQIDLPCRPCSVFGDKPCHRKDYACLNQILPDTIVQKIRDIIGK